jgi:hypothetical protein
LLLLQSLIKGYFISARLEGVINADSCIFRQGNAALGGAIYSGKNNSFYNN